MLCFIELSTTAGKRVCVVSYVLLAPWCDAILMGWVFFFLAYESDCKYALLQVEVLFVLQCFTPH